MTPEQSIARISNDISCFCGIQNNTNQTDFKSHSFGFARQPSLVCGCFYRCLITRIFLLRPLLQFKPKGRVDLSSGEKLIAIFNLDCEHCQEAATELGEQRQHNDFPELYVLFYKEGSTTVERFESITRSSFSHAIIDVNSFFDLIGDSPQGYII